MDATELSKLTEITGRGAEEGWRDVVARRTAGLDVHDEALASYDNSTAAGEHEANAAFDALFEFGIIDPWADLAA